MIRDYVSEPNTGVLNNISANAEFAKSTISDNTTKSSERLKNITSSYIGSNTVSPVSTEYLDFGKNILQQTDNLQQTFGANLDFGNLEFSTVKPVPNEDRERTPKNEDGLLAALFKLFIAILKLPAKFGIAFSAIQNAAAGVAHGSKGIAQIAALSIVHLANIFKVSVEAVVNNIIKIVDFIFKLPKCFIIHCVKCIFAVLYNIFPLFSFICWYFTGLSLMPYFESMFNYIDQADNWIADNIFGPTFGKVYLTKFPPEITNYCYTCNGKPLRLNDIIVDVSKIGNAGGKFARDLDVKGTRAMKPAVPYLLRTKRLVDRLVK
jgi:hypothetical protein